MCMGHWTMGYAEQIQRKLQNLPEEKLAEVLDFVEFLSFKSQSTSLKSQILINDWTPQEFSTNSFAQAMRGMENDPVVYELKDLKERWQ